MRIFAALLFATILWSQSSNADLGDMSPECRTKAAEYVASGPTDVDFAGARLWKFGPLLRAAKDSTDECLKSLKTAALSEAKDYWRHIGSKYGCVDEAFNFPAARPEACSEAKWDSVKENFAYIESLENGYIPSPSGRDAVATEDAPAGETPTESRDASTRRGGPAGPATADPGTEAGCTDCDVAGPPRTEVRAPLARVPVPKAVPNPCAKYDKTIPNKFKITTPATKAGPAIASCVTGVLGSLSKFFSTMKDAIDGMIRLIDEPQLRAAVGGALAEFGKAAFWIAINQTERDKFNLIMGQMLYQQLTDQLDKENCMNADGKLNAFCGIVSGGKAVTFLAKNVLLRGVVSAMMKLRPDKAAKIRPIWLMAQKPPAPRPAALPPPALQLTDKTFERGTATHSAGVAAQRRLDGAARARAAAAAAQVQRQEIFRLRTFSRVDLTDANPQRFALARRVLGVSDNADDATIRAVYRNRIKTVHPDKVSLEMRPQATEAAQNLTRARDALIIKPSQPLRN